MRYRYYLCDVFTEHRFAGNPLAVLPDARGLAQSQMQQIAREFNFSESTFVFPAEAGHTRRVRIFTPNDEIPFAGHPNLGTAFVLASTGEFGSLDGSLSVVFEEDAGPVSIDISVAEGRPIRCELAAPQPLVLGPTAPVDLVAAALSLSPDDFKTDVHTPRVASVGLPFLFAELCDLDALSRVRIKADALAPLSSLDVPLAIHVYVRMSGDFDLRARVMITEGGYEDPATGSANCALVAMLAHYDESPDRELRLRIAQGVEMGRPGILHARAQKRDGQLVSAHIAGDCALVAEGYIDVD